MGVQTFGRTFFSTTCTDLAVLARGRRASGECRPLVHRAGAMLTILPSRRLTVQGRRRAWQRTLVKVVKKHAGVGHLYRRRRGRLLTSSSCSATVVHSSGHPSSSSTSSSFPSHHSLTPSAVQVCHTDCRPLPDRDMAVSHRSLHASPATFRMAMYIFAGRHFLRRAGVSAGTSIPP